MEKLKRSHHAAPALPPVDAAAAGGVPNTRGGLKRKCKAKRSNGKPCTQWAMAGQLVCYTHGGASRQARARGAQRQAAERVEFKLGTKLAVEPAQALLGQVWEANGNVEVLRLMLQAAMDAVGKAGKEMASAERELLWSRYTDERERLAKFSKAAIDAGLAERQVRMAEATTKVIVLVVQGLLEASEMGLSPQQRIVGRELAHRLLLEQSTAVVAELSQ